MTKQDFLDWKTHPVTKEVFSQLQYQIDELKERLVAYVANDASGSMLLAGQIQAFEHLLRIDYEDATHGN